MGKRPLFRGADVSSWAVWSLFAAACLFAAPASALPLKVLVFGDSLTSGFELPEQAGFSSVLLRKLRVDGYDDVIVLNGSVAGDTSGDGLQRISSALQYGADVVIVEFGGNDMLNRVDPRVTFSNLDTIIAICKTQGARVILAGMLSLPKNGPFYDAEFDRIYPALARKDKVSLYPFFLQGVYGHPGLMMSEHEHPNVFGVQRIVAQIAPLVEKNLRAARSPLASKAPR
ncbi:MAG: arylesterase [Methylocystis sp.]